MMGDHLKDRPPGKVLLLKVGELLLAAANDPLQVKEVACLSHHLQLRQGSERAAPDAGDFLGDSSPLPTQIFCQGPYRPHYRMASLKWDPFLPLRPVPIVRIHQQQEPCSTIC